MGRKILRSYRLHIWEAPGAESRIIKYQNLEEIVKEYNLELTMVNIGTVETALNNLSGRSEYVLMTSFKEVNMSKEELEEQTLKVGVWPGGQKNSPRIKEISFEGEKIWGRYDGDDRGTRMELYRGKEKFLWYRKNFSRWQEESSRAWKEIYDSFEEFKEDVGEELPTGALLEIEKELGINDGKEHIEI